MASVVVTGVLTGVNYIPDDVSNGIGALAVPLFRAGLYPPTVLALVSSAAWPGALWLAAMLGIAGLVGGYLIPRTPLSFTARLALPAVLVAMALIISLTTRDDRADQNARHLLETAWLVRPSR
jgi:hypothetical protein